MRRILWFLSLFITSFGCESSDYMRVTLPQLGGRIHPPPPYVPPDAAIAEVEKTAVAPPAEPVPPPRGKPRATSRPSSKRTTPSTSAKRSTPATPVEREPAKARGRANGVGCDWDSQCASGECTFDVCRDRNQGHGGDKNLGNGVACTWDSECASGECTYHVCTNNNKSGDKELGIGVACTWDSECASGECTYKLCSDPDD